MDQQLSITSVQLASVKLLLSSEREVAIYDLLLATAFEYLDEGPRTSQEIAAHLESIWPGTRHHRRAIDKIMAAAAQSNYVVLHAATGSINTWELAERGKLDLQGSRTWAQDIIQRAKAQLSRAALDHFGFADAQTVQQWTEILLDAISSSLVAGFAANPSGAHIVSDAVLVPAEVDLQAIDDRIDELVSDVDNRHFLRTMAHAAMDVSNTFGTELVHTLTLGYILQAFAAGYDNQGARAVVGSLNQEIFILDTPVLLQLAGPRSYAEPLWSIMTSARDGGVRILIYERTIEEFNQVVADRDDDAHAIESALIARELEIQHIRNSRIDQVLRIWLAAEPAGSDDWLSWQAFRSRCNNVLQNMNAIGGEIGVVSESTAVQDSTRFEEALASSLSERGSGRGSRQIKHDAELLANLKAIRSSNSAQPQKIWPGATIVSPDTHLVSSYRTATPDPQDAFPAAVRTGQWAAMLARCCDPAASESIAMALSSQLSIQAVLGRAVAIPIEAAMQIARSLKDTPISSIELESMNISLDDVLSSDVANGETAALNAQELAGKVLERRHANLERVSKQQRDAALRESQEAEIHRAVREARASERERSGAEQLELERARVSRLEADKAKLESQIASDRSSTQSRFRRLFAAILLCSLVLAALLVLVASSWIGSRGLIGGLIGLAILMILAVDWFRNDRGWYEMAIPTVLNAGWLLLARLLESNPS